MDIFEKYIAGASVDEIAAESPVSYSTIYRRIKLAGIMRSKVEAGLMAESKGKWGNSRRKPGEYLLSDETKEKISIAAIARHEATALGFRVSSSGYVEFTRGKFKGRSAHVVVMESRIGRGLYSDECVHHIDGNRANNADNNLALVTRSGHSRLHRREESISGINRERKSDGRFS